MVVSVIILAILLVHCIDIHAAVGVRNYGAGRTTTVPSIEKRTRLFILVARIYMPENIPTMLWRDRRGTPYSFVYRRELVSLESLIKLDPTSKT